MDTFDSTFIERRAANEAAQDLADLIKKLGHHLGDENAFNVDGTNVHVRFLDPTLAYLDEALDGPTLNYVDEARPGIETIEFLAGLIRTALPAVIDAKLDERIAAAKAGS